MKRFWAKFFLFILLAASAFGIVVSASSVAARDTKARENRTKANIDKYVIGEADVPNANADQLKIAESTKLSKDIMATFSVDGHEYTLPCSLADLTKDLDVGIVRYNPGNTEDSSEFSAHVYYNGILIFQAKGTCLGEKMDAKNCLCKEITFSSVRMKQNMDIPTIIIAGMDTQEISRDLAFKLYGEDAYSEESGCFAVTDGEKTYKAYFSGDDGSFQKLTVE